MVRVDMTDNLFVRFLKECELKDAEFFNYEYIPDKESAQNEEDNKYVGLNRDDFQRLIDRINRIEGTVFGQRERLTGIDKRLDAHEMQLSGFGSKYNQLDEKVDNLHDQNRALINAINAYASTPLDVFKLQEQANRLRPSTVKTKSATEDRKDNTKNSQWFKLP